MDPVTYQQTSNSELFCVDDSEVDVVAMATTDENLPQLATPTVNGRLIITGPDCLLLVILIIIYFFFLYPAVVHLTHFVYYCVKI